MYKILEIDESLKPYEKDLNLRMSNYEQKKKRIIGDKSFSEFANGNNYFGLHKTDDGWVFREWAPGADAMYFTGDFNGWNKLATPMTKLENGVYEVLLNKEQMWKGCYYKAVVKKGKKFLERIPSYAHYVVQNPFDYSWCSQYFESNFKWTDENFKGEEGLYIYEAHVGMAQDKLGVGTYREFADNILPRIKKLGYTAVQFMGIMEHPYYGSFGYQVSNFFAVSSRSGTPDDLKYLINTAHNMGIKVILDIIHSHAVKNVGDGLNEFDGTPYQYFHEGALGDHPAWGTKLFNYNKPEVIHFLLSNVKYWLEEYHFDGFRFDGVTSMLYHDHGLGVAFTDNSKYFSLNTDTDAITYLQFATQTAKEVKPDCILICEDMSAMPGMCLPVEWGGVGFDYRLAMGLPDMWIKTLKKRDEDWDIGAMWGEHVLSRKGEKSVAYVESHDQALVGDKTVMFRLCDSEMYTGMANEYHSPVIDRGMALHKMIRLFTLSSGGEAYLNFMGNEFGHPEWIDFPREGNGGSYYYCRRQWNLVDAYYLKYQYLNKFDGDMIKLAKEYELYKNKIEFVLNDGENKIFAYKKGDLLFVFNFNPEKSFDGYSVPVDGRYNYNCALNTDNEKYGGFGIVDDTLTHYPLEDKAEEVSKAEETAKEEEKEGYKTYRIKIYLPARSAVVYTIK